MKCKKCGNPLNLSVGDNVSPSIANTMHKLAAHILCDDCFNATIQADKQRHEAEEYERRMNQLIYSTKTIYGDVPGDIEAYAFESSKAEFEAHNQSKWLALRRWDIDKMNLWLYGSKGVGKTHAALGMVHKQLMQGRKVAYVTPSRFNATLYQFDKGRPTLERWQSVDLLLLDDVDKLNVTDFNLMHLWELLDARAIAGRRTICTSNGEPKNTVELWSQRSRNPSTADATIDRLKPLHAMEFTGESLRGKVTRG
jgi:DNA replication protein DnaC